MTRGLLVRRGLQHYWRTHLAVIAGVGVATSVLAGALLVGTSVRGSLAALAFARLGQTHVLVSAPVAMRESLAADLSSGAGGDTAPLFTLQGSVAHDENGRRATAVAVYAVDDRFWRFHAIEGVTGPARRDAYASPALAAELGAREDDTLLVTVEAPSDIPAGLLQGRRSERARILRLSLRRVLPPEQMGEFALRPTQAAVLAVFVPLALLQREIDREGEVNAVLADDRAAGGSAGEESTAAGPLYRRLRARAQLEDLGLHLRETPSQALAVESRAGLIPDPVAQAVLEAARDLEIRPVPVLTYLANTIRIGSREVPYSVVSGIDLGAQDPVPGTGAVAPTGPPGAAGDRPPLWLNEWAMQDLAATVGDRVSLDYYLWSDAEGLVTSSADFVLAGVVPMDGPGGDPTLMPEYPGLTGESRMSDWDPPFPVDLRRVRDRDEAYWDRYRTAPKALVPLEVAQRLWGSRYGHLTSVRLVPASGTAPAPERDAVREALTTKLEPSTAGALALVPVRAEAAGAARGTTDFGEYFLYFTFFLVLSALLLTGLLFRLSIEQRLRELGVLGAVGFPPAALRQTFLLEGLVLVLAGTAVGLIGALAWAELVLTGLRTWWFDAVGTDRLTLHVSWPLLAAGGAVAIVSSLGVMWRLVSALAALPPRTLLAATEVPTGDETATGASPRRARRARLAGIGLAAGAATVLGLTRVGVVPPVAGFFGAGGLALVGALALLAAALRRPPGTPVSRPGWPSVARLGMRGARQRPGRAVTAVALIAFATFIVVAVGAFRRGSDVTSDQRDSGTGGYTLIGESVQPLMHDPGSPAGRDALALPSSDAALSAARFTRLRLRSGDDASCLTLYRPVRPRVAGLPDMVIDSDRFRFAGLLDPSAAESARPWSTLRRRYDDGTIPAIGDANSLAYVFHMGLGDTFTMTGDDGRPITLRLVGMLEDSMFQSELLIAEDQFLRLFPQEAGYRLLLAEAPPESTAALTTLLEGRLSDYGLDVQSTRDRLASFHRVENTYISTFQALGGLGLLLGTCGVGALVLRSVLERRRELAVLRAVGYRPNHLSLMVVAESGFIAGCGALIGTLCAVLAIAPALARRGGQVAAGDLVLLPALVVGVALVSALAAVRVVSRMPVAATIRNE